MYACCCTVGVPHLHCALSKHEHSVLLLSTHLHGVLCVPSDSIRPPWAGPVPLLQEHTLCCAGGWGCDGCRQHRQHGPAQDTCTYCSTRHGSIAWGHPRRLAEFLLCALPWLLLDTMHVDVSAVLQQYRQQHLLGARAWCCAEHHHCCW